MTAEPQTTDATTAGALTSEPLARPHSRSSRDAQTSETATPGEKADPLVEANDNENTSSVPGHDAPAESTKPVAEPSDNKMDPAGEEPVADDADARKDQKYGWRFWIVFGGLIASVLLSAMDGSVVATALPTIASTLNAGPDTVWMINVYFLTGAVCQPLFGQLSDLWGRRWVFLSILVIFTVGSGLCGGATSYEMLIGARAIQGIGAGGINVMVDLIVCDLVPMRDRGKFFGIVFGVVGIFTAVGPLIGGALAENGHWRWAFYMNIPIGALSIIVIFLFMHVNKREGGSFLEKMRRIDWGGITILTLSVVAVMYAITYGGALRPWSDSSVVTPLVAGLLLLFAFVFYEGCSFVKYPVTPYHLFANRTSAAALAVTFFHSMMGLWTVYMFAVYFQAVTGAGQTLSGVYLIPTVVGFPISAAVGGGLMTKYGRYKPIHLVGFAILTLGCGLAALQDVGTSPALWVFTQLFQAIGVGSTMATLLPAVQARLKESDTALSTGTWAFIRSLGVIWAVAIPAAIFSNRFDQLLYHIDNPDARERLGGGKAYENAAAAFVSSFDEDTSVQVRQVYAWAMMRVWQISVVFSGISLVISLFEKEVDLRSSLETDFGLQQGTEKKETEASQA